MSGGRGGRHPLAPAVIRQQKKKPSLALTAEEKALFRDAVTGARPLVSDRVHHEPPLPPAIPRQRDMDEAAALDESLHGPLLSDLFLEGGDEATWRRNGISLNQLRDLRRGRRGLSRLQRCGAVQGFRKHGRRLFGGFIV